ncbi:MAG: GYD domain-containing protein [Nitrososphaerota archaeon]|nr:GYD domain-containing protein [Candidatus Calditenuaceae archaeon]MDW8072812.1 GYD domain-containing protein [Nitrososphaerota archaeon]
MPRYILLSTLTCEGLETIHKNPNRILEVNKEVEAIGVKIIDQYAVLGPYDFITIVEAPDDTTVARVSVVLGSRGTVKITSLRAIPTQEFVNSMKKMAASQ